MLRETLFQQEVSPRTPRDTNNTECIRGIQDCKAADIAKTVATMIRNNTGHLAQHQRVTEQAHRPIQASLSPGDESTFVIPFAVFSSRSKCYRRTATVP